MGVDCLFCDSFVEDGESAMVDRDWRGDWPRVDDEVHDLFFYCGDCGRDVADPLAAIFFE